MLRRLGIVIVWASFSTLIWCINACKPHCIIKNNTIKDTTKVWCFYDKYFNHKGYGYRKLVSPDSIQYLNRYRKDSVKNKKEYIIFIKVFDIVDNFEVSIDNKLVWQKMIPPANSKELFDNGIITVEKYYELRKFREGVAYQYGFDTNEQSAKISFYTNKSILFISIKDTRHKLNFSKCLNATHDVFEISYSPKKGFFNAMYRDYFSLL